MKEMTFDEPQLAERLRRVGHKRQVAFALSCAERLLPNFIAFQRASSWGDANVLRQSLDWAWRWLEGSAVDEEVWVRSAAACERQAPDTEEFQSGAVSPALDAAVAVTAVICLIQTADVDKAVDVAALARDTVDMFVQELENMPVADPQREDRIRLHSLMQAELTRQDSDLSRLESGVELDKLSGDWRAPKLSNIGLS